MTQQTMISYLTCFKFTVRTNAKDIDLVEEIVRDLSDSLQITCSLMHHVGKIISATDTEQFDCCSAGDPGDTVEDRSQITCVNRRPGGASPFGIDQAAFCPKCPPGIIAHP